MSNVIELFAGPGGIGCATESLGLTSAGIEWDVNAVATRVAAGLATVHGDVRNYGPADFPDANTLVGGPPCQTFTVAGSGTGRVVLDDILAAVKKMGAREAVDAAVFGDERTGLVLEPLRWILEALDTGRPYRAVVLEQVQQVQQVWNAYAEILRAEGYDVATGVLRTEQYGLPQTRRRAVLVARLGAPVALPAPTHRAYRKGVPQHEGDPNLLPWMSMGESLNRAEPFTVISNYGTGGDPRNRGRRSSSEPAATVTGKISRFRIVDAVGNEQPRFTHSEAGQLQGFPADWPWTGNDIGQQIGNACPVPLAGALMRAVTAPTAVASPDPAATQAA